jgi:HEAT repeat protein
MPKLDVSVRSKKLIRENHLDQARELLLINGFIHSLDPKVQKAYFELIPVSKQLEEKLSGSLQQLSASDVATRRKAARLIEREGLKEYSEQRRAWMREPRTTGPLIAALDDADAMVVQGAAGALAEIIVRYFPDLRAYPNLVRLLQSPQKENRFFAVRGLGLLHNRDRWKVIVPLLKDRSTMVRSEICSTVIEAADRGDLSPASKRRLHQPLLEAIDDEDDKVRMIAANALRKIGDASIVGSLKEALKKEKIPRVQECLKRAILVSKGEPDPLQVWIRL